MGYDKKIWIAGLGPLKMSDSGRIQRGFSSAFTFLRGFEFILQEHLIDKCTAQNKLLRCT